jgi:hypothetical protein
MTSLINSLAWRWEDKYSLVVISQTHCYYIYVISFCFGWIKAIICNYEEGTYSTAHIYIQNRPPLPCNEISSVLISASRGGVPAYDFFVFLFNHFGFFDSLLADWLTRLYDSIDISIGMYNEMVKLESLSLSLPLTLA